MSQEEQEDMIGATQQGNLSKVQQLVEEARVDVDVDSVDTRNGRPALSTRGRTRTHPSGGVVAAEWCRSQQEDKRFRMDTSCACMRIRTR